MSEAESVGRIGLDLVLNRNQFERHMGSIQGIAGNWAGKLGKLIGGAFTAHAIASFTKDCLTLGSDLNEVQNVVDVTFRQMSEDVNNWAKNAINSFGLSEKCAKDYIGTLGTMSKSFGFITEKAYEQATTLAGLSADVASFYNLSTDEAFNKLKGVYTGETEGLKSLGVVMTQTALDQYALAHGFGKTVSAMSEMEKVELRLAFVTDALSDASGDFARTSGGWANQTKVLSLRFDALKASLGQGLINVLTPALRMLNEFVARLQTAADVFRDFTAEVFGDAGGTSAAADGAAALAENTMSAADAAKAYKKSTIGIDMLNKLGDSSAATAGAGGTTSVIDDKASSEGAAKTTNYLETIRQKLHELCEFTGLSKLWDGLKQGVARIDLVGTVKGMISNVKKTLKTAISSILRIVGGIWDGITSGIGSFIGNNSGKIEGFFKGILDVCSGIIDTLCNIIGGFFSTVAQWWDTSGRQVWDGLISVIGDVCAVVLDVFNNNIFPIFQALKETLDGIWSENLQPLLAKLLTFLSTLWENVMALWNSVLKPIVSWLADTVGDTVQTVAKHVISIVKTVVETVTGVAGDILGALGGLIDFIAGTFTLDWERAWTGIKDFFGGIWNAIWDIVKGVINLIVDGINMLWTGVFAVIQGIINGVGGLVEAIGEFLGADWGWNDIKVDVPTIPKLASGGYVAANTPQLAVVGDNRHEGEIIAPESKIAEAVAAGIAAVMPQMQTGGGVIHVSVELDGDIIGEKSVEYQQRQLARGNGY